ncbi:uncharacterized protein SETTUDRAFT_92835, partial [Exserohilum turcica Et28A]
EKLNRLKAIITKVIKQKTCKRRYVQAEGRIDILDHTHTLGVASYSYNNGATSAKRVRSERRCGRYSQIRHNFCTC